MPADKTSSISKYKINPYPAICFISWLNHSYWELNKCVNINIFICSLSNMRDFQQI